MPNSPARRKPSGFRPTDRAGPRFLAKLEIADATLAETVIERKTLYRGYMDLSRRIGRALRRPRVGRDLVIHPGAVAILPLTITGRSCASANFGSRRAARCGDPRRDPRRLRGRRRRGPRSRLSPRARGGTGYRPGRWSGSPALDRARFLHRIPDAVPGNRSTAGQRQLWAR